ncbi:hypothetical protein HDV05_007906 [Chytridiales sp. JEL 0842]|nr:hypothetical protein HDV05_007906 [Chytridiales sp. JEL 0842]
MKSWILLCVWLLALVAAAFGSEEKVAKLPEGYAPPAADVEGGETFQFQSENSRVLKIVINSLYKNKDIFLRELISNSADALDKIRFESLTDTSALKTNPALEIRILINKEARNLVITDTGIGMTPDELRNNLGTIAKSGTSEFVSALEKNATDLSLIGQFGVGAYSVFLVSDKVTVASKSNKGDGQYIWESTSESGFTIKKDPRGNTLGRGTEFTLHLKDDALEFLDENTIKSLIKKYSEFITYPIFLWSEKTETKEVPIEPEEAAEKDSDSDVEDVEEVEKEKTKTVTTTTFDWIRVNENKPIWTRQPTDVTDAEYKEFYKAFTKDTQEPLSWSHFKAEGDVDFKSILFIPSKAPPSYLQKAEQTMKNIKLYVRRVFITDEVEDFLPRWLAFIKGLVDSDDLPLNVSRETLQNHYLLRSIKKKLIAKGVDLITQLSKDDEKFAKFIQEYGVALKLGAIEDKKYSKKILPLLRFASSSSEKPVSLTDYVKRMKPKQKQIYFITAATLAEAKNSPLTELPIARGYEVLYLVDPIDEYLVQSVTEFQGKKLQSLSKPGLKFGDDDKFKEEEEKATADFQKLITWMQQALSSHVDKVLVSSRLTKSPTAIVANEYGITGNMERIMAAQALAGGDDPMANYYKTLKKTLEINVKHPLIIALKKKVEADKADSALEEMAMVLFETALLRSGFEIKNTLDFASRIDRVLRSSLDVDLEATADVKVIPAPVKGDADEDEKEEKEEEEGVEGTNIDHDEL